MSWNLASTAIALASSLIASAAPCPAQNGGTGGGTIYFDNYGSIYRMNSDGSGKTFVVSYGSSQIRAEPSRAQHGGKRWFLTMHEIAGSTYPSGRTRRELFAMREDGDPQFEVQLTNQLDLETNGVCHWTPGDTRVSWVARKWDLTGGVVLDGGVYAAAVLFDGAGNVTGLQVQPSLPDVPLDLINCTAQGEFYYGDLAPNLVNFDWSPNGMRIVHDRFGADGLRITDAVSGASTLVYSGHSSRPAWSPDGTLIAFLDYEALFGTQISTITIAGTGKKRIEQGGTSYGVMIPVWSPTGSHLAFARFNNLQLQNNAYDVYRTTAAGKLMSNLTGEMTSAYLVAWR